MDQNGTVHLVYSDRDDKWRLVADGSRCCTCFWCWRMSRRIVHCAVTDHPTAEWTAQQMREASLGIPRRGIYCESAIALFGKDFVGEVKATGIKQLLSAPRSPWQRAYVERVIGTFRRESLDHMIVCNERCLYRHLKASLSIIIGAARTWHWRRTARSPDRSNRRRRVGSSRSRRWADCIIVTSGTPPECPPPFESAAAIS